MSLLVIEFSKFLVYTVLLCIFTIEKIQKISPKIQKIPQKFKRAECFCGRRPLVLHGRIRLCPGYTPGPVNHPNVSCKIGFCDVFSQCHSSNWVFDFIFSSGFPPFSQRLASISFELIGSTGPVFHDESGHATQIRPRPL